MATQAQIEDLAALYAGYFDRAPDPAGLQFWIDEIDGGREFNTIAEDFAASPEAEALYPYLTTPGVSSPALFVTEIYANLFGRAPDEAGLEFWTGVLDAGTVSVADFIEAIIVGAVDAPDATPPTFDQTTLDNKVEVGLDFADATGNTPGFTYDEQAAAAAVGVLDGVTEDPATVDAAKAETAAFVETGVIPGGGLEGTTFTLTSDADNLTGTASDDTFQGIVDAAADTSTLTTFDVLNGGAGLDTFNLLLEDTAAAPTNLVDLPGSFTLSGIEIVNLVSADGTVLDNGSADLSAFTGAQQVWQVGDYASITHVDAGQAAGFRDVDGGSVDVRYFDGATAAIVALDEASDANAFNIDIEDESDPSLTSVTLTGTAAEEGDENTYDVYVDGDAEGITTVNIDISSNSSIEIDSFDDETLKTIDASSSTGDLFLISGSNNYDLEMFMGGSGNDYIDVETYYQTTSMTVDAGAGNDFMNLYWDEDGDNFTSTITGGSGSDTFFFEYLEQIGVSTADVEDFMAEITDFSASEDVLDISDLDFGQLSNTALANIAGEASLKDAIETAADEIFALGYETAVFDYAGDMYVFNDYSTDGDLGDGDGIVMLTGMSTDALDSSNFITMT